MTDAPMTCRRCGETTAPLERPPFRSELGERIRQSICPSCWQDWLRHQTTLINHYGLDPRKPESRDFLYGQIEKVLLGGDEEGGAEVDTSQQGSIRW